MKKIFVAAIMLLSVVLGAQADDKKGVKYTQNGTEFIQTPKSNNGGAKETKTGCTWIDSKGVKYDIYMSSKGRCYVYKTSKKTSKKYKYYLLKEMDAQVAAQMNKK